MLTFADVPGIAHDDRFNLMGVTLISMLVALVAWTVAVWSERRKNWPILEQERAFRVQAESQWQSEAQRSTAVEEKLNAKLAAANHRISQAKSEAAEANSRIAQLQTDTAAAQQKQREAEAVLDAANTKASSLETALEAEKGRISAMQEALEAKQELAKQLAQELSSTGNAFADERIAAATREDELRAQLANYEKTAASGQSMIGVVNVELDKTRIAQADLEKEYATKLSELQRKLTAADQKSAMLQKELMALVGRGGASDSAESVTQAEELPTALERAKAAEE